MCHSKVWIFRQELRAHFQVVKVGIGLSGSPFLGGIVDDTFKITFHFVRELVAGTALCHSLAIYPFAYFVDNGFAIAAASARAAAHGGQPARQWVLSFPFQRRFLFASRAEIMGRVLGIVHRVNATHLVKKAGYTHQTARTRAVTLIQRFGSPLNLNIHFHMLFLDGVYLGHPNGTARFRWVKASSSQELTQLVHTIAHRVGRFLERQGLLEQKAETSESRMLPERRTPPAGL